MQRKFHNVIFEQYTNNNENKVTLQYRHLYIQVIVTAFIRVTGGDITVRCEVNEPVWQYIQDCMHSVRDILLLM